MIEELEQFRQTEDKFESLYTIIFHSISVQDIVSYLFKKLKKLGNLASGFKRKYLNDRLYGLIEYLQKEYNETEIINSIFLIGKDINPIILTIDHLKLLKECNINSIICKNGNNYDIDYLNHLLTNCDFKDVLHIDNNHVIHYKMNETKQKIASEINIKNTDINDYISSITTKSIIHGNNDEIFELFDKDIILKNNQKLEVILGFIENEKMMDKVLIGKDIGTAIKNYQVKTIYCVRKMLDKLHKCYPKDLLNFEILEVKSYDDEDKVYDFNKNFKGVIGVKYF